MLVSARRYAQLHRVHPNTVYRWIRRGLLPVVTVSHPRQHRYFVDRAAKPPRLYPGPAPYALTGLTLSTVRLRRTVKKYCHNNLQKSREK